MKNLILSMMAFIVLVAAAPGNKKQPQAMQIHMGSYVVGCTQALFWEARRNHMILEPKNMIAHFGELCGNEIARTFLKFEDKKKSPKKKPGEQRSPDLETKKTLQK